MVGGTAIAMTLRRDGRGCCRDVSVLPTRPGSCSEVIFCGFYTVGYGLCRSWPPRVAAYNGRDALGTQELLQPAHFGVGGEKPPARPSSTATTLVWTGAWCGGASSCCASSCPGLPERLRRRRGFLCACRAWWPPPTCPFSPLLVVVVAGGTCSKVMEQAGDAEQPGAGPKRQRAVSDDDAGRGARARTERDDALPPPTDGATQKEPGTDSYISVRINGRLCRVSAATPYINTRKLFGAGGVLLQDVTVQDCPVLLLPCPHTGNVTVRAGREYKLMKFIGEHICLAGDYAPVRDDDVLDLAQTTVVDGRPEGKGSPTSMEVWLKSGLTALLLYLRENIGVTASDFFSLTDEQRAEYEARGSELLLKQVDVNGQTCENQHGL
ncbi:hypothetical protein ERJ75_001323000 [Trypanosoma vivax]|uniref:Uncharacterized protein n=1 Tax=Trypanosoma vivax (strain Y486) TaxID=1055687 RepID=G0U0Y2_TRYVY|nr:hypothetical protein ERJ75_001323400 [Trypanosoma vivax]KAH8607938.1 hypothetical protein ERJ75_001323000 [Trypanosoma vivax]CCC49737.1 conserved hypothetical protein [Trypanosoma vivax Y486]